MRYYVVSDIHAFFDELLFSLKEKGFFDDNGEKKLVVCGDILDRGKKPVEMEQFLMDLLRKDEVILIKGNHDDMMIELLSRYTDLVREEKIARSHYTKNGTVDTLGLMTGSTTNEMLSKPEEVVEKMRNRDFVKEIYPKMVDYFETDKYLFLHGWIPCKQASDFCEYEFSGEKDFHKSTVLDWEAARWFSYFKAEEYEMHSGLKKTIVCGHRSAHYGHDLENALNGLGLDRPPDFSPYYGDGYIAIDGCTLISGKVNCLVIDEN